MERDFSEGHALVFFKVGFFQRHFSNAITLQSLQMFHSGVPRERSPSA